MKPIAIKYRIGQDTCNRAVYLTRTEMYAWEIHVEAANQCDESQTIRYLPDEVLIAMAEAVRQTKGS